MMKKYQKADQLKDNVAKMQKRLVENNIKKFKLEAAKMDQAYAERVERERQRREEEEMDEAIKNM